MSSLQMDRGFRKRKAEDAVGSAASDYGTGTLEPLQKRIKTAAWKFISKLFRFNTVPFIRWKTTETPPVCIDHQQSCCDAYAQTEIAAVEATLEARGRDERSPVVTGHHSLIHKHSRNSARHLKHKTSPHGRSHAHEKLRNGNGHAPVVQNSLAKRNGKLQLSAYTLRNKEECKDNKEMKRKQVHVELSPSKIDHRNLSPKHDVSKAPRPTVSVSAQSNASINTRHVLPFVTTSVRTSRSGAQRSSLCAFYAPTPVSTLVTVGASRSAARERECERELNGCSSNSYSCQYFAHHPQTSVYVSPFRLDERDQFRALLQQYTSLNVQLSSSSHLAGTTSPIGPTRRHSVASNTSEVITLSSSSLEPSATPNVPSRGLVGTGVKQNQERALYVVQDWSSRQETFGGEFVPLPSDAESLIELVLHGGAPEEVLVEGFRQRLKRSDLLSLLGLNWLNDEVINFYLQMLAERSVRVQSDATVRTGPGRNGSRFPKVYSCNTFFYPKLLSGGHASLKRWTKKVDLFDFDMVLVPVHLVVHWCLTVIDFRSKTIRYYDSMGGENYAALRSILKYLDAEHRHKKNSALDRCSWRLEHADVPQQLNGSDCGVFACKFAEFVARDAPIVFTQQHMPYYRKRMMYELLTKRLLNHN